MSERAVLLEIIITPLGPVGLAALFSAIYLYSNLSSRLGAVTKMPPYHRWFFVGGAFTGLALVMSILRSAAYLSCSPEAKGFTSPRSGLLFFHIPLLIGMVITLATAWRYWAWLLVGEPGKESS